MTRKIKLAWRKFSDFDRHVQKVLLALGAVIIFVFGMTVATVQRIVTDRIPAAEYTYQPLLIGNLSVGAAKVISQVDEEDIPVVVADSPETMTVPMIISRCSERRSTGIFFTSIAVQNNTSRPDTYPSGRGLVAQQINEGCTGPVDPSFEMDLPPGVADSGRLVQLQIVISADGARTTSVETEWFRIVSEPTGLHSERPIPKG